MDDFKRKYLLLLTPIIGLIFIAYIVSIAPKGTPRSVIQETCEVSDEM